EFLQSLRETYAKSREEHPELYQERLQSRNETKAKFREEHPELHQERKKARNQKARNEALLLRDAARDKINT
ncbi:hypothetical protein B484DRAFT_392108, partial [Ochromonadaceae sp. CCMP2298]